MMLRIYVALIALSLAGCEATKSRLDRAARADGELIATRVLPEWPGYCRDHTRSGVREGDRLDVALLKTDAALFAEHERTDACAKWYDELRDGYADAAPR